MVIALVGFTDATYLTIKHYNGSDLSCGLTGGCNEVTSSEYSTVFGIPVALGGALYYLAIFLSTVLYFDNKKDIWTKILQWLPIAGLLASAWFVYLQLYVIHAICQYCMASAATSTLLFILGMSLLYQSKKSILD